MIHSDNVFHQRYVVYIPQKLDLDKLLFDNPIKVTEHKKPDQIRNRLAWLVGQIYSARRKQENKYIDAKNGHVRLSSKILEGYSRRYIELLSYLIECGVLEHTDNYSNAEIGGKCNTYRITDKYYGRVGSRGKWKPYYIYEEAFVIKIEKNLEKLYRPTIDGHNYLIRHFEKLDYDDNEVERIFNTYDKDDLDDKGFDNNALSRIRTNYLYQFKRHEYGRFYSPLTNMNKKLRSALRCGGEQLIELDIKTSIPYFSLSLFNNEFLEQNYIAKQLLKKSNTGLEELKNKDICKVREGIEKDSYIYYRDSIPFMFRNNGKRDLDNTYPNSPNLWETYSDIAEYRDIILNGDIYQYCADIWNEKLGSEYTRDDCKKLLLTVFNSPAKYTDDRRKVFKTKFPNVMKVFEYLNTGYFTTHGGKGKNKWKEGDLKCPFAMYTQGLESWFVLDVVCRKLEDEYAHVSYYTIHDAIYVTSEFAGLIRKVISEESERLFKNEIKVG